LKRQLEALQGSSSAQSKQAQQAIAAEKAMQEAMIEFDQRLQESKAKIEAQSVIIENLSGELAEAKTSCENADTIILTANQDLQELQDQVKSLSEAAATAKTLEREIENLNEQLNQAEAELDQARAKQGEAETSAIAREMDVKTLIEKNEEKLRDTESLKIGLEKKLEEIQQELARTQEDLTLAQQLAITVKEEAALARTEAASTKADLKKCTEQLEKAQDEIAAVGLVASTAQSDADSAKACVSEIQQQLDKAQEDLILAQQSATNAQKEIEATRLVASTTQSDADIVNTRVKDIEEQLFKAQEDLTLVQQAATAAKEEAALARTEADATKADKTKCMEQLAKAEEEIAATGLVASKAQSDADSANRKLNETTAKVARLEETIRTQSETGGEEEARHEEAIYQAMQGLQEDHDRQTKVREQEFANQLEKLQSQLQSSKQESMDKSALVNRLEQETGTASVKLAAVQEELKKTNEEASTYRTELETVKVAQEQLTAELVEAKANGEKLESDVLEAKAAIKVKEEALIQAQQQPSESIADENAVITQKDIDVAVTEALKMKEETHQQELMKVRIEAAKRMVSSPQHSSNSDQESLNKVKAELEEAKAQAQAAEIALSQMQTGAEFTQEDVDAVVAKKIAEQEEAHKKDLMTVRVEAAKRFVTQPRANEKAIAEQEAQAEQITTLKAEVESMKAAAAQVSTDRQREKSVLVQEIRRKRSALDEQTKVVDEQTKVVNEQTKAVNELKEKLAEATASVAVSARNDDASIAVIKEEAEKKVAEMVTARDRAQNTIDLQYEEIKRLKQNIANLEGKIEHLNKELDTVSSSLSRKTLQSPAVQRVKLQTSLHSPKKSDESFTSSQFGTNSHDIDDFDDEDDTDFMSPRQQRPSVDSPRTQHEPRLGQETSYVADNEAEEDIDDDEEEERLAELEDEMVNWLYDHGFGKYENSILDLGVEMMDDLILLGMEELNEIGMDNATAETFMYAVGSRFKVGERIKIVNLAKAQQFNGLSGYVMDPFKKGRYTIKLDEPPHGSTQTLVSCYPTNLVKCETPVLEKSDPVAADKVAEQNALQVQQETRRSTHPTPINADQKSRLLTESVSPADTLNMVRNPGTWSKPTSGAGQRLQLSHTEWMEVDCADHPPPRCSLGSPLIQQILQSWTRSTERLDKMNAWLRAIMSGAFNDADFSWGIEIAELTTEVANGFLTVLLPLVVIRAPMLVNVYVRLSHPSDDRRFQPTIDLRLSLNGWQQVDCSMNPAPKCDVLSPLIQNLLECWTTNRERLRRMNDWLQTVMVGRFDDEHFMDGIEMLELPPEIVQGFLTMLVPLIQARAPVKVKVYLRQALKSAYITLQHKNQNLLDLLEPGNSDGVLMDLRLSVIPRDYTYTP
jgi:chromosome segregation ATPase